LAVVRDVPLTLKPAQVLSEISHFKAKGTTPSQAKLAAVGTGHNFALNAISENSRIIAEVYEEYAKELKSTNSLDFDDLLIFGVQLLKTDPNIVKNTRHVLVDELYVYTYFRISRLARKHKALLADLLCSFAARTRMPFSSSSWSYWHLLTSASALSGIQISLVCLYSLIFLSDYISIVLVSLRMAIRGCVVSGILHCMPQVDVILDLFLLKDVENLQKMKTRKPSSHPQS
jgi:UvrD/REP helicase N-terminal domain